VSDEPKSGPDGAAGAVAMYEPAPTPGERDPEAPALPRLQGEARNELMRRAAAAAEFLEAVADDMTVLSHLDEPMRRRLTSVAGRVSRPDRYMRKALGKALIRQKNQARRAADRAILDETGIRALRREPVFITPLHRPDQALEAPVRDDEGEPDAWAAAEAERADAPDPDVDREGDVDGLDGAEGDDIDDDAETRTSGPRVQDARMCYVCKSFFNDLHFFYDGMCIPCGTFNYEKRTLTADLRGRVVMVTGARVKIGYQAAIKLLRCGAEVVVATRFPRDAGTRFLAEPDSADWERRLHIYGVDLRHTPSVEALCDHLVATLPRLDGLINNACQTVRRPSGWYDHLLAAEHASWTELDPRQRRLLDRWESVRSQAQALAAGDELPTSSALTAQPAHGLWHSAVMSQVPLLSEDLGRDKHLFPTGRLDADLQQVDLRATNSWRMTLAEVPTAELLEVQLVNAVAPFVLNARLKPLFQKVTTRDTHIVNVSAMEGQFYRRWKTDRHPHTNMAKAALNMMTRTSAIDYVKDGIHMNAVDTGWVTDEDAHQIAERKTRIHGFHPPLDIVDGAARIVDPLLDGINTGNHVWGLFLKDYKSAPW
jgi:NAD(P)-dependent dehydrogenase (short-subunit alcohol dehydrogenase family)